MSELEPWSAKEEAEWNAMNRKSPSESEQTTRNEETVNENEENTGPQIQWRDENEKQQTIENWKNSARDEPMTKIQPRLTQENKPGVKQIEREYERTIEDYIEQKEKLGSNQNMLAANSEIQLTDSMPQSLLVPQDSLKSMRLVNSSLRHLEKLMLGVTEKLPPASERLYDVDRVQTACLCAKQITELLRVKMDLQHLNREMKDAKVKQDR